MFVLKYIYYSNCTCHNINLSKKLSLCYRDTQVFYTRNNVYLLCLMFLLHLYIIKVKFKLFAKQLGPVGVAAAAAIVSAKKRKRPHSFETNPSVRKRQQNRLLRKLRVSD